MEDDVRSGFGYEISAHSGASYHTWRSEETECTCWGRTQSQGQAVIHKFVYSEFDVRGGWLDKALPAPVNVSFLRIKLLLLL